jgi:hypothetical protein
MGRPSNGPGGRSPKSRSAPPTQRRSAGACRHLWYSPRAAPRRACAGNGATPNGSPILPASSNPRHVPVTSARRMVNNSSLAVRLDTMSADVPPRPGRTRRLTRPPRTADKGDPRHDPGMTAQGGDSERAGRAGGRCRARGKQIMKAVSARSDRSRQVPIRMNCARPRGQARQASPSRSPRWSVRYVRPVQDPAPIPHSRAAEPPQRPAGRGSLRSPHPTAAGSARSRHLPRGRRSGRGCGRDRARISRGCAATEGTWPRRWPPPSLASNGPRSPRPPAPSAAATPTAASRRRAGTSL